MKTKALGLLFFVVLFIMGLLITNKLTPWDRPDLTTSYTEEISVYVPPDVTVVQSFDPSEMSPTAVTVANYKHILSLPSATENKNFMSTSLIGAA